MLHSTLRIARICLAAMLVVGTAHGENTQQDKMKTCNAQAKEQNLAGDPRKDFMKTCLSAAGAAAPTKLTPQQQKMKSCNSDAKTRDLKGEERKTFMKSCLSGK